MYTMRDVIEHFGGSSRLAEALGVSPQAISQWNGQIPPGRAYQIESLSAGKFKACELPVRKSDVGVPEATATPAL